MKRSLGISNFLEEISSLSQSVVFLYFFALITEDAFLSLLAILWNSAFRWVYLSFSPLLFASLHFNLLIPKMSVFSLSCLATSNLPWFMDLTFQFPMQYYFLQHQTLLLPPDTSTLSICFCFGPAASFFLELLVISLLRKPSDLGGSYLFAFSYCPWGSIGKNTGMDFHFLLQWTVFCQNSSLWTIRLGWPYMAWLMASLSDQVSLPW